MLTATEARIQTINYSLMLVWRDGRLIAAITHNCYEKRGVGDQWYWCLHIPHNGDWSADTVPHIRRAAQRETIIAMAEKL